MKSLSNGFLQGIALSLFVAAGAHAQSTGPGFSDLDVDGSGEIELDEFHHEHSDGDEPLPEQTDAEHDGFGYDTGDFDALEGRDLDQTLFERYDADNSRSLDRDEYQEYQDNVIRRLRDF